MTGFPPAAPLPPVTPEDSGAKFGFNLHFHTLARAQITGVYGNRG